jgi:hypothetical protein
LRLSRPACVGLNQSRALAAVAGLPRLWGVRASKRTAKASPPRRGLMKFMIIVILLLRLLDQKFMIS